MLLFATELTEEAELYKCMISDNEPCSLWCTVSCEHEHFGLVMRCLWLVSVPFFALPELCVGL